VTRQYLAGVAAGAVVVVSLSGCQARNDAGPAKPGSAVAALKQISQKTSEVGSFRLTTDITGIDSGEGAIMKGHADIRSRPSPVQRWTISGTTAAGKEKDSYQEIVTGDSIYLKLPAHVLPTHKPWARFSRSKANLVDFASPVNELADMPHAVTILTASKDIHEVGRETVDGIATTHYNGTYAMPDALAKLRAQYQEDVTQRFQSMNLGTMAFDLWVDGSQLPRKVRMSTPDGAKSTLVVVTLYTAINTPITITAPPPSQVADGAHLPDHRMPGAPA
jgi:LppX_LprAFG lipoprotein